MRAVYHLGTPRLRARKSRPVSVAYETSPASPPAPQSPSEESNLVREFRRLGPGSAGSKGVQSPCCESNAGAWLRTPRSGIHPNTEMAPSAGFEPATLPIEAACTSIVLRGRREPVENRTRLNGFANRVRHQTVRAQVVERVTVIETAPRGWQPRARPSSYTRMERPVRIELTSSAWKAVVLPLNYGRKF